MPEREKPTRPPTGRERLRDAAEERLERARRGPGGTEPRPESELLHELQVHQIELEMQNDELRRAQLALQESRDRYVDLYDFAPIGYFSLTRFGRIISANLTGASLLGVPRTSLIQQGLGRFIATECIEPWERHLASLVQVATSPAASPVREVVDLKMVRADGSPFFARLQSVRLDRAEGGEGREAVVDLIFRTAISDVTQERKARDAAERSDAEVRALNTELERRVRERTAELEAFTHTVAHDLKTPLRGIDGFAAILLEAEGERWTDEERQMLGRIRAASQRGGRLIEDLLRLSRLSKAELRQGRIDLSKLALQVAERIQALEPERRVDWVVEPGLTVAADAGLVEELLEELLGNAWKFTAMKETARIELGATERERRRFFFIRDNGAGFDMAHSGELFGTFHRAHSDSEFPGLGIGLTIAAKVVQRHGGTIRAEGEPGLGTSIFFTL